MRDEENENRDGRSWREKDSGGHVRTLEDADALLRNAQYAGSGLPNIAMGIDEKTGKSQVLGFTVSRNVATIFRTLIANVVPWLSRSGGETAYNFAYRIAGKRPNAALIAKAAESAIRWGIVGASPIVNLIYASRLHSRDRKALFEEFAPVMAATKANYKNNEVIRVAFDELHEDIMMDLKLIAADIPTLVPQILAGIDDQKKFYEKKKHTSTIASTLTQSISERKSALDQEIKERHELREYLKEQAKKQGIDEELVMDAFHDELEARRNAHHVQREDADENDIQKQKKQWLVLGGSLVSEVLKDNIHERSDKRRNKANAWKMIQHLKRELEEQRGKGGDQYAGVSARSADEIMIDDMSLKNYVVDIFQQHERNRAKLNGEKIAQSDSLNPLGPALVEHMQPAIDLIAEYIADGRLDPDALVTLVGENKIVIHQKSGARSFAKVEDVRKTLDELLAVMSTREAIKPEEFFADFADPALIQNTLKQNIQSMQGMEKAFFVSLFPNDILEQAGMSKKEINAERKRAHKNIYDIAAASVLDIAKKDGEQLKKLGLSDPVIVAVSELAQSVEAGDRQALERAVDGQDKKAILGAIRTVGLHEQTSRVEDGENYWIQRVKEAPTAKKIIEKGAANQKAEKEDQTAPLEETKEPSAAEDKELVRQRRSNPRSETENGPTPLMDRANREEPLVPGGRSV